MCCSIIESGNSKSPTVRFALGFSNFLLISECDADCVQGRSRAFTDYVERGGVRRLHPGPFRSANSSRTRMRYAIRAHWWLLTRRACYGTVNATDGETVLDDRAARCSCARPGRQRRIAATAPGGAVLIGDN